MNIDNISQLKLTDGALSFPRAVLPQLNVNNIRNFMRFLQTKQVESTQELVKNNLLKCTQGELDLDKINSIMSTSSSPNDLGTIYIANDNYVIDGHHRWVAHLNKYPDTDIKVIRLNLNIYDAINMLHHTPFVKFKNIKEDLENTDYNFYRNINGIPANTDWTELMSHCKLGICDMDSFAIEYGYEAFEDLIQIPPKSFFDRIGSYENLPQLIRDFGYNNGYFAEDKLQNIKNDVFLEYSKKYDTGLHTFNKSLNECADLSSMQSFISKFVTPKEMLTFIKLMEADTELSNTKMESDKQPTELYKLYECAMCCQKDSKNVWNAFAETDNYEDYLKRLTGKDLTTKSWAVDWENVLRTMRIDKPHWEKDFRPGKYIYDFLVALKLDPYSQTHQRFGK